MIVAAAVMELRVHGSQSLKAKRGVVRSICGRLRNRFNVSVSEVGGQGTWQRAVIGLSMTGSEEVPLRRALERAVAFVEGTHLAEVLDSEIELIRLPLAEDGGSDWAETAGGETSDLVPEEAPREVAGQAADAFEDRDGDETFEAAFRAEQEE